MNILHCAFEMETGGSQVLVVDLLNEMSRSHTVGLIIINDQYNQALLQQLNSSIRIYYLHRKQGSLNPVPIICLNLLLHRLRPDIIHCHEYNTARYIRVRTGKLVYTAHAIGLPVLYYHRYRLLAAISTAVYNDIRSRCSFSVTVISNGIDFHRFKRRTDYIPQPLGWKIVQVGRLEHEIKGQDILLHALGKIIYGCGITGVSLDFIGSGHSLAFLQLQVKELRLDKYVRFMGDKERTWLSDHLADYHLLVQPSRFEGFGLSILEGIAAGLPVVAADVFGPGEILQGIPGGFLFTAGNEKSCAHRILEVFELYANNRISDLTAASAAAMEKKYSLHACTTKYLEAYCEVSGMQQRP